MARSPTPPTKTLRRALPAEDLCGMVATETVSSDPLSTKAIAEVQAFVALARLLGRAAAREYFRGDEASGNQPKMEKPNEH